MPHRSVSPVSPGTLFVIGGAEDRIGRRAVLRHFVSMAGGNRARIAIVATASSLGPEIFDTYDSVFADLGAAESVRLRPESRTEADDPEMADQLADVDAVFMTGGNQVKLSAIITGTRFGEAVRSAYDRGALVGGTSAGASIVSEHMVAFGSEGDTPRQGMTQTSAGLGLLPGVVVDQHFDQRSRYGRLLALVARSPSLIGIGIDEDTAAVIHGGRVLEVVGRGCVFVVDGAQAVTDAHLAEHGAPMLVSGATVHTLPQGARFDLAERRLLSFAETHLAHQLRHQTEDER